MVIYTFNGTISVSFSVSILTLNAQLLCTLHFPQVPRRVCCIHISTCTHLLGFSVQTSTFCLWSNIFTRQSPVLQLHEHIYCVSVLLMRFNQKRSNSITSKRITNGHLLCPATCRLLLPPRWSTMAEPHSVRNLPVLHKKTSSLKPLIIHLYLFWIWWQPFTCIPIG